MVSSTTNKFHSYIEISKSAILHNITLYKKFLPAQCALAPVIKGNAYGHGICEVASILDACNLVDYLCIVSLSEALLLRSKGITKPLLVLSIIDAELDLALELNIDLVVYDFTIARAINDVAQHNNRKAAVHLKIDTGLSRLGVHYEQATEFVKQCTTLEGLKIVGIFSHFASSERSDTKYAQQQLERFNQILIQLNTEGIFIPLRHLSCSAALTTLPTSHLTFARFGISTYGLWPSIESKVRAEIKIPGFSLRPALTWKSRVIAKKTIPAGSFIGYDCTYQTSHTTELAILPVGYYDGYCRTLSNRAVVKIKNQLFPVRGHISMNITIIDITTDPTIAVGDEAILLGDDPLINAEALAEQCGTINYELTTRINPFLPRIITT